MPPYVRRLIFLISLVLVGHPQALSAQTATATTLSFLSGGAPVTSVPAGTIITMSAAVTGGASPITGGTIYFCDSIVKNCMLMPTGTAQVVNGAATFKTILSPGTYSFTAIYVPTVGFSTSTSPASTLSITASLPSTATLTSTSSNGGTYSLKVQLTSPTPTAIAPTGTVTINDTTTGTVLGSGSLPRGGVGYITLNQGTQLPGDSRDACSTATGDFNGDGRPDIAIGLGCKSINNGLNTATALQILLNNGDGTFTAGPPVPAAMTNTNVTALTVGDFNNDGTLDLIVADRTAPAGSHLYLLANDGTGAFTASQLSTVCGGPSELVTADFNRDGNLDFAAACGPVNVFLGTGTGSFTQNQTTIGATYGLNGQPKNQFAVADFDQDGYPDIAAIIYDISNPFGSYSGDIFTNAQNGKDFTQTSTTYLRFPLGVIAGDFHGDGNAEIVLFELTFQGVNGITASLNGLQLGIPLPVPTGDTSISTGDFNHDGVTDFAFVASGSIGVALGTSSTPVWTYSSIPITDASDANALTSAVADFNGDDLPDIVASGSDQSVATTYTVSGSSATDLQTTVNVVGSGSHAVSADYSGDAAYAPSTSNTLNLNAGRIATSMTLTASPSSSSIGTQVALTATLQPYSVGSYTTNGDLITFSIGTTILGTAALNNGIAVLNVSNLPIGPNLVYASFPGDTNFSVYVQATTVTVTTIPAPTVSPTSLNIGSVALDSTGSLPVIVTNTATGPLAISSIQASTGFTQTNNCGSSLASLASCTITVSFAPTTTDAATGTLTINTNAATPAITVPLSGKGFVNVTPQLTASPNPAAVGSQVTLTVTVPATSHGYSTNGLSVVFGSLGTATVTNGAAVLNVTSLPVGSNRVTAEFQGGTNFNTVSSNDVTVVITNIKSPLYTPGSINFGTVGIGSSVSQTVTLTNNDTTSPLTIASVQISNGFSMTNHCGASLAVGASCTVTVTFAPTTAATFTGTLTFTTNANTSTSTVSLTGSGVVPVLALAASPTSAPIGVPVTLTASLTPNAAGALTTNGKTVTFSSGSTSLGTETLNNGVAILSLTSLPLGSNSITANFAGDADFAAVTSSPVVATVTAPPAPTVSPASINFGAVHLGFSTTQTVSLTNTSIGPLTIASVVANSGFTQSNNCGSSLAAAASCTITVTFAPTTAGAATGSLSITTNASAPITTVALSGSGVAPVLYLTASPTSTSIGTQVALTATMTPYSNGNLTTNGKTVSFTNGSTTVGTATLNNGTALLNLTNLPIGTNSIVANFAGDANFPPATSGAVVVTVTGPTAPTVSPSSVNFGSIILGNAVSQTVTLTNVAATPLTITAVQASGGFTQTNTCGNLAVSASCTATVTFAPTAAGAASGTLTFTTTAVTSTTTVTLSGTGVAAISPGTGGGSFGTIKPGSTATLPVSFTTAAGVSGTLTTTCMIKMANGSTASNPPTCTASPGTFTVSGGSTVTTTLTVSTTAGSSAALHMPETGVILAGGLLSLLAFFRRRPAIASLLLLLFSFTAMTMITGCAGGGGGSSSGGGGSGGGGTPTPSTTAGAYTVTVTATIGTQTSSVDLPLTIQ
ncbi:beta strand repeat-containing protein [Terriglobus roseus]|uniref:Repeat domain-containing protein n=1 Tax=Terriglobus roseus TaxID=392734 RepID=A0A1G7N150_9BACT|nr:Ig-like domain repeat protein [Terriglobus roseus]SDF67069.1 Repeat domain-containing protein [Terriglobus roseus]